MERRTQQLCTPLSFCPARGKSTAIVSPDFDEEFQKGTGPIQIAETAASLSTLQK